MSKALKPLIIVLFLLSVASLVLGVGLFQQRDTLKNRNLRLSQAVVKIARSIHVEDWNEDDLKLPQSMEKPLGEVIARAIRQHDDLQFSLEQLETKKSEYAQAMRETELYKNREIELSERIDALQNDIEVVEAERAQAESFNRELANEKRAIQAQIDELNGQLVQADEGNRDLEDQLAALEQTIQRLEGEIGVSTHGLLPTGISGNILVVNSDWNFVIIDVGQEEGLQVTAEMLVHRDERFIGKVRVSEVRDKMAVAEILRDWEQLPIQRGDYVLF